MNPRWRAPFFAAAQLAGALAVLACTPEGARDVVPASHDVITTPGGPLADPHPGVGYDYVTRRPGAVVALAEARGIPQATARTAVDRVADSLASCIAERGRARSGASANGAARLVARVEPNGVVGAASLRVDPGGSSAEDAVLCFVAPVKSLVFPPVDAGARGFAIEALWGPVPDSR